MQFDLIGGYRIREEWAAGQMAIDWATRTLYMVGHIHEQKIMMFDLPELNETSNQEAWPILEPHTKIDPFWPTCTDSGAVQYPNGLLFNAGENALWVIPRAHYEIYPNQTMPVYRMNGDKLVVNLPQQRFSGFIKLSDGQYYFGCGGYESGQGTCSGPTMGYIIDGPDANGVYPAEISLQYEWLDTPGESLENWHTRAPRLPDYDPQGDSWLGWNPREIDGELQGRFASDWIWGGGILTPDDTLLYFPYQGTDKLYYRWPDDTQRTITFAEGEWKNRTRVLAYKGETMECIEYGMELDFTNNPVRGQEIDSEGRIYLAQAMAWGSGNFASEVMIRVYKFTPN